MYIPAEDFVVGFAVSFRVGFKYVLEVVVVATGQRRCERFVCDN